MSQRPSLDPSSFEKLLLAAWVLQREQEHDVRKRCFARIETLAISKTVATASRITIAESDEEVNSRSKVQEPGYAACRLSSSQSVGGEEREPVAVSLSDATQGCCGTSTHHGLSSVSREIFGKGVRQIMRLLWDRARNTQLKLESLAEYKVKVRITLSPRRALAAAGGPLSALLILAVCILFQMARQQRFNVVAASSGTQRFAESGAARALSLTSSSKPSHRHVTDPAVLSSIAGLSRYEVQTLRRQAYYGDDSAALIMGMLYETGRYVPQSCAKAADWVARSATWGNAAAQYNLGLRYRDGDGLPADEDQAEKWLRKSADQRYSKAMTALQAGNASSTPTP